MPNYGRVEKGDFEPRQLPVTGLRQVHNYAHVKKG
jgi:hypothetical protein